MATATKHAAVKDPSNNAVRVEIFDQAYLVDRKNDDPEQFRVIGWSRGRLCAVIFEMRRDADGEYYHLVTAWKATEQEEQSYAENI